MRTHLLVGHTCLALALGISAPTLNLRSLARRIPEHDEQGPGNAKFWRIETLQRWNPAVAARCAAIQAALEQHPLKAA